MTTTRSRFDQPMMPEGLHDRPQTYKSAEACRRSFYKWVCKQGLYTNLIDLGEGDNRWLPQHCYRAAGTQQRFIRPCTNGYTYGMPRLTARGRSQARAQWGYEFIKHRIRFQEQRRRARFLAEEVRKKTRAEMQYAAITFCHGTVLIPADIPDDILELKHVHLILKRKLYENTDNERTAGDRVRTDRSPTTRRKHPGKSKRDRQRSGEDSNLCPAGA